MPRFTIVVLLIALIAALTPPGSADTDGFAIRGIKGLWWDGIDKYQLALPWLAAHRLNFLMLCYSSFPASATDWRSDYAPGQLQQIRELAEQGRKLGVDICLSFNPGIWSKPPLVYSNEDDYQRTLSKVNEVHALRVSWFALCLDDISRALEPADIERFGTLQAAHVHFVNRLWGDMQTLKPAPKLIFCPSAYSTDDAARHKDYITTVGRGIHRDVMMFWTGPAVCSPSITAADAAVFAKWIRRKPFVWDNYPVNDMYPWRPLLAPLKNRSADLAGAVSGYVANPMKQLHASALPLAATAAYLTDPAGYDPQKAMHDAVKQHPPEQHRALWLLLDLYGSSFWGEAGFPPQPRPADVASARKLLPKYRVLRRELSSKPGLADLWADVSATLDQDIALLERKTRDRRADSPLGAFGDDFEGGAADLFGSRFYNRCVNYVYARPTGRHEMRVDLYIDRLPARAALRLTARNDDSGRKPAIRIAINGRTLYEGESPFAADDFLNKPFEVAAGVLAEGANTLTVTNLADDGALGMPPWFMVADVELAPGDG